MDAGYRICTRCIMDTTDPHIEFDTEGLCNHCRAYEKLAAERLRSGESQRRRLHGLVSAIKEKGRGRKYDCLIGLSGGTDSSFVAYKAAELGLRPLAVHVDNGWNTEISVKNVEKIVQKLGYDFYTYTVDWEEFRDLQLAFFKASVVDIEMVTDHAISAVLYEVAKEKGIKYILVGGNIATEGVMPKSWRFRKSDAANIEGIYGRFGTGRLETFPLNYLHKQLGYRLVYRIKRIRLLDYVDYKKQEAMNTLQEYLGWEYYGGKHYESTFTKFYQAYILPTKFNIDKRRAHLSTLICSGQMSREEALEEMEKELYPEEELVWDKDHVLGKLGLSADEFEAIMRLPVKSHLDFPNHEWFYRLARAKPFKPLIKRIMA